MNGATNSPPQNKLRNPKLGCALISLLIVVGLITAATLWGPTLSAQLTGRGAAPPLILEDRTSPAQLEARRAEETAHLSSYGWIDREAGVIHIPVDRAIDLLAEIGLPVGGAAPIPAEATPSPQIDLANVSFQEHVLPIFQQHCIECHGDERTEEGLKLTSYRTVLGGSQNGSVVEPGDPEGSYLVKLVTEGRMPKRGDPLSASEIEIIVAWITAGALDN